MWTFLIKPMIFKEMHKNVNRLSVLLSQCTDHGQKCGHFWSNQWFLKKCTKMSTNWQKHKHVFNSVTRKSNLSTKSKKILPSNIYTDAKVATTQSSVVEIFSDCGRIKAGIPLNLWKLSVWILWMTTFGIITAKYFIWCFRNV